MLVIGMGVFLWGLISVSGCHADIRDNIWVCLNACYRYRCVLMLITNR